jgi:hypothetical protein
MPVQHRCLPEHDLMVTLVWGEHTSEEALEFIRGLDQACATRWVAYLHPTVDMAKVDVAHIPALKRGVDEKRHELFGDRPRPHAVVCGSKACDQYFDFWRRYYSDAPPVFHSLDDAYDGLGLSEAARAVAARLIGGWEADAGLRDVSPGRAPPSAREPGRVQEKRTS